MPTVREESIFDPHCPFCGENIRPFARICPHCRSDLAASPQFQAESRKKSDQGYLTAILVMLLLIVFFAVAAYYIVPIL